MKKEREKWVAVAWPRLRKIKDARRGRLEGLERGKEASRRKRRGERKRKGREGMNERSGRGWWREMRGSRPTSSENSSPAEFLISPRHPHLPSRGSGWKKKGAARREREREREEKGIQGGGGGERTGQGRVGWTRRGGIVMRAFFTDFSTPVPSLSLSLSLFPPPRCLAHTLPRVATSRLHPLAPTEREDGSGGGGGGGGDGGGSVFLITTAIFFSSRDDAAAKRYRNIPPPINPVLTSSAILQLSVLIDRWNAIESGLGVDRCHFISYPCYEIVPLWTFFSEEGRVGDVGVPPGPECRKVASACTRIYIYTHIYAHKKRWSEEGYVRMSGMGLWNRWMGDDTLLFAVSACATRAMIGFERERERERDARRWQCIVWSIIIGHARVLIHRFNTHTYETDFEVIRCNMWLIQEHAHRSRVTTHISWKEIRESTVAILDIACIPRGESID